jgi:putative intracellular protease/amidase
MENQTRIQQQTRPSRMGRDILSAKPRRILQVVSNPTKATTTGQPVGFWAAELSHPYYEFLEAGYEVTIASPKGGKVEIDLVSDPRHPSKMSAHDLISLGFLSTPELVDLLENTPALETLDVDAFDALVISGGTAPMFTFRDNQNLHTAIRSFYEAGKLVGALCHGVAALVDATLSDGSYLVSGKTVTGFANVEEDFNDRVIGTRLMPWRLEDALKERGATYVQAGLFKPFAIYDGRVITGQQQYSGRKVAQLVIEALGH